MTTSRSEAKAFHGTEDDRTLDYRLWHRKALSRGCYVMDIDQVEFKIVGDTVIPLAVIELTRADNGRKVGEGYLGAILRRFDADAQGKVITTIANLLGVNAFIVLYSENMERFWIYDLTDRRGWINTNAGVYKKWLERLRDEI